MIHIDPFIFISFKNMIKTAPEIDSILKEYRLFFENLIEC